MSGFADSFNVSVAASLVLHEVRRQRINAWGHSGDMEAERSDRIKAVWYLKSVRESRLIVERAVADGFGHLDLKQHRLGSEFGAHGVGDEEVVVQGDLLSPAVPNCGHRGTSPCAVVYSRATGSLSCCVAKTDDGSTYVHFLSGHAW